MKIKRWLLLVLCLSLFINSYAQLDTEERIEFELKEGYGGQYLAKFGEDGLLIHSKNTDAIGSNSKYKIERFSSGLKLEKTKYFDIPRKQFLDETYETDTHLYMFFKSRRGAYTLLKIDASNLKMKKQMGNFPKRSLVYKIRILGNMAFFDAAIKGSPVLITINTETGKQSLVPIIVPNYKTTALSIEDIQVQEKSQELFVYVNAYIKRDHELYVIRINENGKKLGTFNLTKGLDKKLSSISASYMGEDDYIYTGTYSTSSTTSGEGVYICRSVDDKREFIEFYNFLDFEEFLSYLPEKRQAKIEKKKARKEKRGKELSINYMIASHDIILMDGNYIFIGEAFYPTYRTETTTTTTASGATTTTTKTVFDGYQYTHATIASFDENGKKLWDKTFELWPSYKPFHVKKFITTAVEGDMINLLFASTSTIYSITYTSEGDVENKRSYDRIETGSEDDKVRRSWSNIDYWYDNHFLSYGLQIIKNKSEKRGKKKRRVFFINKISYN